MKAIDVSEWQGSINWPLVASDGIEAVVVRHGYGQKVDSYFYDNVTGAIDVGLHVGVYHYSLAGSVEEAVKEAELVCRNCADYTLDLPIYIDLEESALQSVAIDVAAAFISKCEGLGRKAGIYANLNWFNNYIPAESFADKPLWIAQYNDEITHANPNLFGMWQYSDSGSVSGIAGNVDLDELYIEYWDGDKKSENKNEGGVAMSGNDVIRAGQQHSINFTGFQIAVDGERGPEVQMQSVRVLQRGINADYNANIDEDGLFGGASKSALGGHYVREGETQYMVTALEILLMLKGYNPNGVECPGQFGSGLGDCLEQYQRDNGLDPDRIAGAATFMSLIDADSSVILSGWDSVEITNFGPDEFKCACGCGGDVQDELKHKVQAVRNELCAYLGRDAQICVTSGFRCPPQNAREGGVPDSLHQYGEACDIYTPGMSDEMVDTIAQIAHNNDLKCGTYYTQQFVHVQLGGSDFRGD